VSKRPTTLSRGLAAAFLDGPWGINALVARAADALGRRARGLLHLARAVIRRFPDPPIGNSEDLAAFIDELSTLGAVHIRHWHFPEPAMVAPLPALAQLSIPPLTCGGDLAAWLKINSAQSAWLADEHRHQRRASSLRLHHYHYSWIPKRSGAYRLLEAPKAGLKSIQRRILREIIDKIPAHDAAHGFRRGRSVLTFASAHADRDVVLRVDLADFFSTITEARVRAIFQSLGYPSDVARTLAALCCTPTPISVLSARPPARSKEEIAERSTQRQSLTASHLPQGAPTSPALANLVAYRLDQRLGALATARDARYTRYADDLAFSGNKYLAKQATDFIANVAAIAADEGFNVRFRKTRVMQRAVRQQLGGIVVNVRPNLARADLDLLEAILFNCVRYGAVSQNRASHPDFRAHLAGRVAWAEHAGPLGRAARLRRLFERIEW
jgi:RNA-directed DNA polymerase